MLSNLEMYSIHSYWILDTKLCIVFGSAIAAPVPSGWRAARERRAAPRVVCPADAREPLVTCSARSGNSRPEGTNTKRFVISVAVSVWALLCRTFRVRRNLMFVRDSVFPSCTMFEWTEDECLQLIELYKTKALLWDPKHPNYFKKSLKEESWREIACELGSYRSDVDCKNKIVSLLSSHRREKNKTKQSQSSKKGKVCFFRIFNNNILHSVYCYVLYNLIQNRLKEWNTLENIVDGLWAGAGGSQKLCIFQF